MKTDTVFRIKAAIAGKRFILWLTFFTVVFISLPLLNYGQSLNQQLRSIEAQRRNYHIKHLQRIRQVQNITYIITDNQKRLEGAKVSLVQNQARLTETRYQLEILKNTLDRTVGETERLSQDAGNRLRSLYMGERLSLLQMILDAQDLSTLLDRLFYKQKLVAQDKQLLQNLRTKTMQYRQEKQQVAQQKESIAGTIVQIQSYQSQVSSRIQQDRMLREKYQKDAEFYEQAEQQLLAESANIRQSILRWSREHQHHKGQTDQGYVGNGTGIFAWPLFGSITSGFGSRFHPIHHRWMMHTGLDISAPMGAPVHASDSGQVIEAGWRGGYGKVVIISHGERNGVGMVTLYGHLSGWAVTAGQSVHKGQVIGYVGATGFATGPHLHFEIRENGTPTNPRRYL